MELSLQENGINHLNDLNITRGFPDGSATYPPGMQETQVLLLGWEDPW